MSQNLEAIRQQINGLDEQLVLLLKARFALATDAAEEKKRLDLALFDGPREALILESVAEKCREVGIEGTADIESVQAVFKTLLVESKCWQKRHV